MKIPSKISDRGWAHPLHQQPMGSPETAERSLLFVGEWRENYVLCLWNCSCWGSDTLVTTSSPSCFKNLGLSRSHLAPCVPSFSMCLSSSRCPIPTQRTHTTGKQRIRLILLVGCLTSQQHASVSQGRICSDNFTCCHTEIEVADQTFQLTQSQYTDTGPTSPSTDPITPGPWQGSYWSANF